MKAFGVGCFTTHAGDNPRGNPIERYTPHAARQTALVSGHDCRYSQSVSQSVTTTLQAGSTWPSYTLLSFCFESSSLSRVRWVSLRLSFFLLDHATNTPNTLNTPKHAKIAVFCFLLSLFRPLHACGQLRACACAVLSRLASIAKTGRRHFATIQIQAVCLSLLQPFLSSPLYAYARFSPSPACLQRWSQPFP